MDAGTIDADTDSARLRGLKQVLPQQAIDRAIGDHLQTRFCKRITNHQLIRLIVGLGLFSRKSYRQVFRLNASALAVVPTRATLTNARKRLSAAVLEQLADSVVKLLATSPSEHTFAFYKGLRLMGIDGTLLDCPDTDSNRKAFGRASNQTSYGAFPKVRVVSLCELGTRVLWRSNIGSYHQSEQKLALPLLESLTGHMLLLADRHFGVATMIYPLIKRAVPLLIRVKKSHLFPVENMLSDGSYLSTIYYGKNDRVCKRPGKIVRVIRYTHKDPSRPGCGDVHVLITSLLDEKEYPATELIELYHVRWEEEIAFFEWKGVMCGGSMLRSQSPEMVRQEIRGMLISHFIIRSLIFRGAEQAGVAPIRISFTGALDILHARLPEAKKSRPMRKQWLAALILEISQEQLPERVDRINPRKLKKRSKAWPTKHDTDRRPPKPNGRFSEQIEISI
jgi:hypothetical protein